MDPDHASRVAVTAEAADLIRSLRSARRQALGAPEECDS